MSRTCFANESIINYLKQVKKSCDKFNIGLVIGQPCAGKDYLIHCAKTPLNLEEDAFGVVDRLEDISASWVANHAKQVTRMLPGGMYVLGVFIVSQTNVTTTPTLPPKLKSILAQINKTVSAEGFMFSTPANSERLILGFNTQTQQSSCRYYDVGTMAVKNGDLKVAAQDGRWWTQLSCRLELDQVLRIGSEQSSNWPLKKKFHASLESINKTLSSATYMFDGAVRKSDAVLEMIPNKQKSDSDFPSVNVILISPYISDNTEDSENVTGEYKGEIVLSGQVACEVWIHAKATIKDAKRSILEDIVRSLAARLELHCDSLTEEEHGSPEDTVCLHELPRRVLFRLPNSKISLSDYLFPGEGLNDMQTSLQELLDLHDVCSDNIEDVEGQADINKIESQIEELTLPATTGGKNIYAVGLIAALIVLILSLAIHFVTNR